MTPRPLVRLGDLLAGLVQLALYAGLVLCGATLAGVAVYLFVTVLEWLFGTVG